MKKLIAIVLILFFLCPLLFCETTIFLGGIYDNYDGNDWGVEGSIDSDFLKDASLSASVDYRYNSNYSMSFTADYKPLFFILGGGLDFKINKDGVYPGLKANIGCFAGNTFLLSCYGSIGINASNVSAPTMFELGLKSRFVFSHITLQLNGFFNQESNSEFTARNLFGDLSMIIYSPGFLYSLKTGAQADFSQDSRRTADQKQMILKGTIGVGKNKDSGTFVIQLTFNIASLIGPNTNGFAVSIGKFPGKTSYIY